MIDITEWNNLESDYNTPKDHEVYCADCGARKKGLMHMRRLNVFQSFLLIALPVTTMCIWITWYVINFLTVFWRY